jgi:RNA polymerase sigma-70 factor (ECF subfamily)
LGDGDLEDLSQDIVYKVLKYIDSFNPGKSSLRTWVARISDNCFKDALRVFIRRQQTFTSYMREGMDGEYILPAVEFAPGGPEADAEIESAQSIERIEKAIDGLEEKRRHIVSLLEKDMKPGKMAELIGCPPETVYSSLHSARKVLRKKLGRDFLAEYGVA